MTEELANAFAEGGGGGLFTANYLLATIIGVTITALILLVAKLIYDSYSEWGSDELKTRAMIGVWTRSIFIMSVTIYIVLI